MSGEAALTPKRMRLRYSGPCRICDVEILAGTLALYERETKTVSCLTCAQDSAVATPAVAGPIERGPIDADAVTSPEPAPENLEVFGGTAGASARREYDRRKDKRETRIRENHPHIGGLILALSDEPQSTRAWAVGAQGEVALGQRLDKLSGSGVHVLHDRRIPPTRANIDHIAVCPSGVFVIDAKKYQGRPRLQVEGGLFRPRTETLMVGSHKQDGLVAGVLKQVARVSAALADAGMDGVPVHGMLCFVAAEWPLFGGDFVIDGVHVLWPKKAVEHLQKAGPLDEPTMRQIHRALASAFPPA
ncbi:MULTISPECIES: nuclease-related domain-containing protein [unclassified Cryobacterium]|uniref:nuclease-related domain-containing protein n=1 Tax=unclassified Cryobacterium TaxID=2649013 RepID=UPI001F544E8F|nr:MULTISPECIES: nuclease-related domain-containing protein [unclassified Cryobacterium]